MGVGNERHELAGLPTGINRYPLYRRLGGPQGRSEWGGGLWKISSTAGFDPRIVQPIAS